MRFVLAFLLAISAHAAAPVVMFTDLISGPNTGGENGNGTILTIYGRNFGATRGTSTVTVGGGTVADYLAWGGRSAAATDWAQLETISVAIGSAAATGTVVVTTPEGASTCVDTHDACQFTVRSGNIRCVAVGGSDAANGNFPSSCWATITKAAHSLSSGDIAYVKNGVNRTGEDNYAANVVMQTSCTAASPCALVTYPGAVSNIGSANDQNRGIYLYGASNWVIKGFNIVARNEGIQNNGNNGARIIGNTISCPNGNGQDACLHAEGAAQNLVVYGNYHHTTGTNCTDDCKEYHTIYFSTNSNHIWVAWNEVAPNPAQTSKGGCRAIQFYSTGGSDQYDLHVHDNYIHDAICDGLNFSTVTGNGTGGVEAYNNIIFRVGTGPTPTTSDANYACINVGSISGYSTPLGIYNNTMYDCGSRGVSEGDAGAITVCGGGSCSNNKMLMVNNIIQLVTGEGYFSTNVVNHASCTNWTGSTNNIFYGVGALSFCSSTFASTLNQSAGFVSTSTPDFRLSSAASPANGSGSASGAPTYDFFGVLRPNPPSRGAIEYAAAAPPVVRLHFSGRGTIRGKVQ